MRGYDSLPSTQHTDNKIPSTPKPSSSPRTDSEEQLHNPPLLYSTPTVSAALITAFGLPTLIECEHPSSSTRTSEAAAVAEAGEVARAPTPPSSPQFTYLPSRLQSHSLPDSSPTEKQQRDRKLRNCCVPKTFSESDQVTQSFNAYTYRVRTLSTNTNEHRLRLSQNTDGSYSHHTPNNNMENEGTFCRDDDASESDTGLLMSQDLKAPVSLGTVTRLEETVENMDQLPPHIHPSIPREMLNSSFTQTAPPLKLWPLAILVFYNVSGGPFGIEPSIRAGGNFYAIIGFLVFPLIWSVPEALVTAELGAAFQDPAAGVAWVEEAFGETMGSLCGYFGWVSGATDNAIYPTLFMEYVSSVAGWDTEEFGGWARFGSVAAISICLAMLNWRGLEIVGNASLVVSIIAMSPFLILIIVGAPKVVPSRWFQMPEEPEDGTELFDDDFQTGPGPLPFLSLGGIIWRPYLNNLFWNLNSFDNAASFAGETTSPSTTFPRGVFIGLILCVLSYILPLLVAVGATDYNQADWVDGHLGAVAVDIGGKWLGAWTIFAAGISNLALFEAEMSSDAFQLMGMAERGYLPKMFRTRSKYGTPTAGIIFNTMVVVAFGCADFGQLLELLNSVYALSLLMEYAAFVKLRLFHKDLQRPYRIPIPDWAAVLLVLPPTFGMLLVILISNWYVYLFCIGAVLLSLSLFKFSEVSKHRGWFTFESKDSKNKQYAAFPQDHNYDDIQSTEGLSASNPLDSDPALDRARE